MPRVNYTITIEAVNENTGKNVVHTSHTGFVDGDDAENKARAFSDAAIAKLLEVGPALGTNVSKLRQP